MDDLPGWDESERPAPPSYPTATAGDLQAGQHLAAVHDMFRQGLATVAEVVARVVQGDADVGEARAAVHALGLTETYQQLGSWCGQVCRAITHHHQIEDAWVYPPLRSADGGLRDVLDRLTLEHEVVHAVLERVDETLVALARDGDDDRSAVERLSRQFTHLHALLLSHFRYEEDAIGTALGVHRIGP
ncbi:hemerythrin domain-containing protein [Nocardioides taihuensis]|uniref:Hemerythrin domain-containing protein n=1 Tax=Nocardioides taihuensis TaxID=1835606 RepID=A0ABW0BLP2_9ACTN